MYPIPPKEIIVNAAATIDLPCSGRFGLGTFGVATFVPSISQPPPPINEITDELKMYGDTSIIGRSSQGSLTATTLPSSSVSADDGNVLFGDSPPSRMSRTISNRVYTVDTTFAQAPSPYVVDTTGSVLVIPVKLPTPLVSSPIA